jgi:hypothetical protein
VGTAVTLETTALVPLQGIELVVFGRSPASPARYPMSRRNETFGAKIAITQEGAYYFETKQPNGRVLRDPVERRIELEPDGRPRVILYGPPNDLEVSTQQDLDLGFQADDDYGLGRVQLAFSVEGQTPQTEVLWQQTGTKRTRSHSGKHTWDIRGLKAQPGCRIAYWIEVQDNDTVSGPKVSTSLTRYIKIYSPDEKHRRTLAVHQRLVDDSLKLLSQRLLLFENTTALGPRLHLERIDLAHAAGARFNDNLSNLHNMMKEDPLVPSTVLRTIGGIHQRLNRHLAQEAKRLRDLLPVRQNHQVRPSHIATLESGNKKLVREQEEATLLLADLLDVQRLQQLQSIYREMQTARERLNKLVARYRTARDPQLKRQILTEIAAMQHQLQSILREMSGLRQVIPDEYLNREALGKLSLGQKLSELAARLRQDEMKALDPLLKELDNKLNELQSLLDNNLSDFRSQRLTEQERAFSEALDRTKELEREERRIAEDTATIIGRYQRSAAQLLRDQIAPFIRRTLPKATNLEKRVAEIDHSQLTAFEREQVDSVKKRVAGLRRMLQQVDVDQALGMAKRAHNGLRTLYDDLADELGGRYSWRREKLRKIVSNVRRAQNLADELETDLEGIFPAPESILGPSDRQQLRQLVRRQNALRQRTEKLTQKRAGKSPDEADYLPPMNTALREAAKLMGSAAGRLGSMEPQEAHTDEVAAADALQRIQQKLRRARQPRDSGSGGRRERIKIPGIESFKPPKEFRQDILDAMKERAPAPFLEQVKRYYRELVR